jgi:hypothetical protein
MTKENYIVCGIEIKTEDEGRVCNKCYTWENIVKYGWQDSP